MRLEYNGGYLRTTQNGRFVWCAGGCCHEEILKRFPQFKMFVDLHCLIITARQCTQLKTGFIILQTAAKKLQLTICVLQKRSIIYFIRQKINNTLNTFFIRLVSLNAGKEKQQKAENEKRVMLAVLDAGLSVCNVIYYDHSNELVFNWKDYETKVTENDFNKFVSSVNRSLLPAGITFKMK